VKGEINEMIMKPELLEFKKTSEAGDSTKQTPNDP
jgi:hypothetical protein